MDEFITLTCPSCGAQVTVTEDASRYRCAYCGNEHVIKELAANPKSSNLIRPVIPAPASVHMVKDGQSARIVQRWFSIKYIPLAFFCVAWDAFLCFWYSMVLGGGAPWIFIVFPIAHLAIGVGLTYSTLCGFVNRTVMEIDREALRIWFEPLPWLGEKTIKTADLKQFYCKEKVSRSENSTTRQYQLFAVTQDNRQVQLISNLDSPDAALYIEQQVERWLKIKDQPVAGAYEG